MSDDQVVIVSNRGPASFAVGDDGALEARRGSGGLVSGLSSLGDTGASWFAAAITDGDRIAAERGPQRAAGFELHLLAIEPTSYEHAYDVIANETLWFLHHGLWNLSREPRFDDDWREAWHDYRVVNRTFADAVAEHCDERAIVLVQDYHLALMGKMLAERRPDLRTVHFHHTPFASAEELRVLPQSVASELLNGLCGFDACGFHTHRWAVNFAGCSAAASMRPTYVAPLGIDPETLWHDAHTAQTDAELARLEQEIGDQRFLVRVDRIELSKNLLRGFDAFDALLERDASWRGRVTFGAFCYPSRGGVPAYAAYREEVEARVAAINDRWGRADWTPILLEADDNYERSLAALRRADAVLVNPVRDGLNLVAKESAIINERSAALVLSDRAGAWEELHSTADGINPFDVAGTATALDAVLRRPEAERAVDAAARRTLAAARTPADWLEDQLDAARKFG